MPQISITQLPQAQALTGTESVPIVQGGVTVQTTTGAISGAGALNYPFLTVGSTVGLTQARQISAGSGLSLSDGGAGSTLQINLTGAAASLNSSPNGIQVKTGLNTLTGRQLTVGGGMTIANGDGVSGNPLIGLNTNLQNLSALSGTGLMTISGSTFGQTTLQGTANQIDVANGNASGGNPTFSLASDPVLPGTGGVQVPSGSSGQRLATNGVFRYNTTLTRFEGYQGGVWVSMGTGDGTVTYVSGTPNQIVVTSPTSTPVIGLDTDPILPGTGSVVLPQGTTAQRAAASFGALRYNTDTGGLEAYTQATGWGAIISGAGVSTFSAGATGLTPSSPTSGGIVLGGTLNVASGGTGAISLTGYVKGSGTSAFTASSTVPTTDLSGQITNLQLQNSAITINGSSVSLGGSTTVTAATPNPLTAGTGLQLNSGTTFDGSVAKTISIDSSVVTLTGTQTLTGKTISGASNTLSNIPNSSLTNSSLTINGTSVSLGASATITSSTTNSLTFNNSGAGSASGTAFNGSTAYTISYNTVGASPLAGSSSLTTVGTVTSGTWNATPIANNYLANSSLTIGTTSISLGGTSLTLGGLTSVAVTQDPTSALQLATKQYVDTLYTSGIHYHQAVKYEVPDTTGNLNAIYNQPGGPGVGVGATLTNNGTLAAFAPDGPTAQVGDRILVYNQTNAYENGVYTVTVVGSGSVAWMLTRATDADTYNPTSPNGLGQGDAFFITSGNTGAGETYECNTVGTITFGTTAITFVQISSAQVYSAGTGLNLSPATTFNISNTGVTAASYGTASSVPTIAVNAQGQITSASNTSIAINGNQITSGTVGSSYISGSYTGITGVGTLTAGIWNASTIGVAYGGTGLASYTTGDLVYASATTTLSKLGIGTNGQILTSSGTVPQWTSGSSISVGTATNLAGGTAGALPYQTGAGATTFLSLGTTNYVLTAGASAPQYVAQSTLSVGSATNATNTTNVGITANSTNATNYLTFVSATTGNLPQLVNSSITCNPSTGAITGGISGGTF